MSQKFQKSSKSKKIAFVGDVHLSESAPKIRKDADYLGTLLKKLQYIFDNNDVVFFLGDVFKTSSVSYTALCRIVDFLQKKGNSSKSVFSIIGNHDVPYTNQGLLYRTSLGVLDITGFVNVVHTDINLYGVSIKVVPFARELTCPTGMDIMLGHCFFENELDTSCSIATNMIDKSCKYVILGHDHSPYPDKQIKNTDATLIRPGSICRDNGNPYNFDSTGKRVGYFQVIVCDGVIESASRELVPSLPIEDVFTKESFSRKEDKTRKFQYLSSIEVLLDNYAGTDSSKEVSSVLSVMTEMKIPVDVVFYVRELYSKLNMDLK